MNKIENNRASAIARATAREEVNPMTSKKKYKRVSTKKPIVNKLMVIDKVLKSDDDKTFEMSVSDFKALFSTAQLNRGWTKPQLEYLLERLK